MLNENDFISISYEEWNKYISMYFETDNNVLCKYIQSYPFTKMDEKTREMILSRRFFDDYIRTCAFLNNKELKSYKTVVTKNDGTLREINLVTPIIFLFFIVLGGHFHNNLKSEYKDDIHSKLYAGDYDTEDLNYSKSYERFTVALKQYKSQYDYYIKMDISNFYPNIRLEYLFKNIEKMCNGEDIRSLYFYKKLLEYFGKNRMPIIMDNTGISFIATMFYLTEYDRNITKRIESFLDSKDFELLRYVDDLYIVFNCDGKDIRMVKEQITQSIQNASIDIGVNININKQGFGVSENIDEELYKNIYDYIVNLEDVDYKELFSKDDFVKMLKELYDLPDFPDHKEVEDVLKKNMGNNKYSFHYTEIFNWLLYKNKGLFHENEVVLYLTELSNKLSIFRHYPKQFIQMLLDSNDGYLIKNFLRRVFEKARSDEYSRYYEIMIYQYLLGRNFKHNDLKKILKDKNNELFCYINNYCEHDVEYNLTEDSNEIVKKMNKDRIIHYLYFMYLLNDNQNNLFETFAYYKNYFDRHLAYLMARLGINDSKKKKGKVSFEKSYQVKSIKKIVDRVNNNRINELADGVRETYKFRNQNPVIHSGSQLLDSKNLKKIEIYNMIRLLDEFQHELENEINNMQ